MGAMAEGFDGAEEREVRCLSCDGALIEREYDSGRLMLLRGECLTCGAHFTSGLQHDENLRRLRPHFDAEKEEAATMIKALAKMEACDCGCERMVTAGHRDVMLLRAANWILGQISPQPERASREGGPDASQGRE
jgi:hypothetical protein